MKVSPKRQARLRVYVQGRGIAPEDQDRAVKALVQGLADRPTPARHPVARRRAKAKAARLSRRANRRG